MVGGTVLCVIISMALQVPSLDLSAYMVFFLSQKTKQLTVLIGLLGLIGATIGIGEAILLYKFTYGHPELRIPGMAITLFLGMYVSRVLVLGQLGFLIGFVSSYGLSVAEQAPSPELLVRGVLWIWVAIAYGVAVTVVVNSVFLPDTASAGAKPPKPKSLFVPDAFTNPAHVRFALKVTFAAMFCYIFYSAIDWTGIHTAFITCTFIALESTGATLHKGVLRMGGAIVGGALALFTLVFLMPHMVTIASLVVVVACASAIAVYRSRSLSSTASSKVMRPTQISITSAIASLEFFSVFSSPGSSSPTSGRSIRSTDCGTPCGRRFDNWRSCSKFPAPKLLLKLRKRKRTL
jgi:uncharacterized membrane protein YccC